MRIPEKMAPVAIDPIQAIACRLAGEVLRDWYPHDKDAVFDLWRQMNDRSGRDYTELPYEIHQAVVQETLGVLAGLAN